MRKSKTGAIKIAGTPVEDVDVLAVATFGDRSLIDELTKRFSLWQ
jgi:hypothetical protein